MGLNEVQVARAVRARFLATSNFTVEMAAWQVAYEIIARRCQPGSRADRCGTDVERCKSAVSRCKSGVHH